MNARDFKGTVEEFETMYPELLGLALTGSKLTVQDFEKENAFILQAVRTCAGITADMAVKFTHYGPQNPYGVQTPSELGDEYKPCSLPPTGMNVSSAVRGGETYEGRALELRIGPNQHWGDREGIHVDIRFTSLVGEPAHALDRFTVYGIASASVIPRGSTAGQDGSSKRHAKKG